MLPDRHLEIRPVQPDEMEHERALLSLDPKAVSEFYAVSGPGRQSYTEAMAVVEAKRILLLRQAQADGLRAMMQAEADGYRLIGEALAKLPNANLVMEIAKLHTIQRVADFLADGKATKIFLPSELKGLFSILSMGADEKSVSENGLKEMPVASPSPERQ